MIRGLFVTGTDTGVGKTVVAALLLRALGETRRAVGMKPVAAGVADGESLNADVRSLIAAGNVDAPLRDVNPFSFAPPIAPELAARAAATVIDLGVIADAYSRLAARADAVIVEGAGGVLVPLTRSEPTCSTFHRASGSPSCSSSESVSVASITRCSPRSPSTRAD